MKELKNFTLNKSFPSRNKKIDIKMKCLIPILQLKELAYVPGGTASYPSTVLMKIVFPLK